MRLAQRAEIGLKFQRKIFFRPGWHTLRMQLRTLPMLAATAPNRRDNAPPDGESHVSPLVSAVARPLNKLAMTLMLKQEIEGLEKLPAEGGVLLCPNHQSFLDPPLVASLSDRDTRFMAAREQFQGIQGWVMGRVGAFPVDRRRPGIKPLEHTRDLLDQGKAVVLFTEGGIFRDGTVHELKPGAARAATTSACQSMVPIVIHFQRTPEPGSGRKAASLALAAGVTALAAAGACLSPTLRVATGALAGGYAGSRFGQGILKKALLIAAGAAAGGVTGALSPDPVGLVTGLGTGVLTWSVADAMARRDTVKVVVCDPLNVPEYVRNFGALAEEKLTEDLHTALSQVKTRLHAESESIYPL
ncbi:1-acyl-sn-glycerol-3-phosphate acyltransferase [bacterium CPR1]|nr:1-acyl-sn-glycerol-3-phosphate acyltransferase [bacterium CPR1]